MTEVGGRTALITGGANGIGLGIARAFAAAGAKLALVDLDDVALQQAQAELSKVTEVDTHVLDVRDRETYKRVSELVESKLGPVSILVNNAGVAGGAPAHRLSYEMWDWGMGINLDGVINGIQTFMPNMVKRNSGGHIVNTASGAGLAAASNGVLYHTAKFAVVGLTEALRTELEPLGIGATVLCPGPVATDIIARTRASQPRPGKRLSGPEHDKARAQSDHMKDYLEKGTHPDRVGEMVLAAVRANQLYIHTDRVMYSRIEERAKALLDAMPVQ
jgi:NAD(P)-dependent dehydrogenase (short-subunit alcohol dehydrogenase family)